MRIVVGRGSGQSASLPGPALPGEVRAKPFPVRSGRRPPPVSRAAWPWLSLGLWRPLRTAEADEFVPVGDRRIRHARSRGRRRQHGSCRKCHLAPVPPGLHPSPAGGPHRDDLNSIIETAVITRRRTAGRDRHLPPPSPTAGEAERTQPVHRPRAGGAAFEA